MPLTSLPVSTLRAPLTPAVTPSMDRPRVRGKFLFVGDETFYIRGVTYGPFRPGADGNKYHNPTVVAHDFAEIRAHGFNAVRTYTVPPRWLLDIAQQYGLRVMVGLAVERQAIFLDDKHKIQVIEEQVRAEVRACGAHAAVLCYTVGNEIPASIVRWQDPQRVARYLKRLYEVVKAEDPEALVTYVNYPSTEYLQLPFLDLVCFNVYLEQQDRLEAYLARLHNIAADRPLIMSEIGLDSLRNGEDAQACSLAWQARTAFATGCAGVFVFAWTDEWFAGGVDVADWQFGLTRRDRQPKPALAAVREVFQAVPFPPDRSWPRISVIVCSYNGARTLAECCAGLRTLDYPNYEVIVVDDGSADTTASIAQQYGYRVIRTENRGLSSARNTGLAAASGEIVAYLDDDAYPDPHWLTYLAIAFQTTAHAGLGGPNIAPPGDGFIADCVANAPGGPVHVLVGDQEAEHIPGCNMAFRKVQLQAIGGFDPQFRVAGDDVDVCWRIQQQGWTIGFCPAAMVWHHRRNSVRAFWKQQRGYGRAEALLERKWPEKYNAAGQITWAGRIYGKGLWHDLVTRQRIYHGTWGSRLFQSIYEPAPSKLWALPRMPEWYLVTMALGLLSILGVTWQPLFLALPLFVFASGMLLLQAGAGAAHASFTTHPHSRADQCKLWALTALLYLLQPLARLWGRFSYGLTPWRRWESWRPALPRPRIATQWSGHWQANDERLKLIEATIRKAGVVRRGGDFDRWDLEVRTGLLGAARVIMTVQDHDAGVQLIRLRSWPKYPVQALLLAVVLGGLAMWAGVDQRWAIAVVLGGGALLLALRIMQECGAATSAVHQALENTETKGAS